MRYQFDLIVHRVNMYVPFQTGVSVIFARGKTDPFVYRLMQGLRDKKLS